MRKTALIVAMAFWLLSGASPSVVLASFGKEAPAAEPPACPARFGDSLETDGIAHDFKHGVTPPKATISPEAEFSDKARREFKKSHLKRFNAVSVLSMIVGEDGIPRDLCLMQPAGYDLDGQAAKAARQYRFEPAKKDGEPIPARITIEVNFRLRK